jgi:hypothetical protein
LCADILANRSDGTTICAPVSAGKHVWLNAAHTALLLNNHTAIFKHLGRHRRSLKDKSAWDINGLVYVSLVSFFDVEFEFSVPPR